LSYPKASRPSHAFIEAEFRFGTDFALLACFFAREPHPCRALCGRWGL